MIFDISDFDISLFSSNLEVGAVLAIGLFLLVSGVLAIFKFLRFSALSSFNERNNSSLSESEYLALSDEYEYLQSDEYKRKLARDKRDRYILDNYEDDYEESDRIQASFNPYDDIIDSKNGK